jgi:HEAT repeat protein
MKPLLCAILVAASIFCPKRIFCAEDPSYKEKPLSVWMGELRNKQSQEIRNQAQDAIRQIGTNALPFLLEEMRVLGVLWKNDITNFYATPAMVNRQMSVLLTFDILGPWAKSAIPELRNRINDNGLVADFVAHALIQIDPKVAAETLTEALTNQHYYVSCVAANRLYELGTNAEIAVPNLIWCLKDKSLDTNGSSNLREFSANALGVIRKPADEIIPALIQTMQHDNSPLVRRASARSLSKFETNSPLIISAFTDALQREENPFIRVTLAGSLASFGTNALTSIPVLIQALQQEKSPVARAGFVNALGLFGTNALLAVPILRQLSTNDSDIKVRSAAAKEIKKLEQ